MRKAEEAKRKISEAKKRMYAEEYKDERSTFMRELWADEHWKKRQVKVMLHGLLKRPTSLELQFIEICQTHDLPFEYVGDGKFLIGSKNPDFIHTEGRKICVEVANTCELHHPAGYKQKRKTYFSKYGWDCICFMCNELDESEVLSKLEGIA